MIVEMILVSVISIITTLATKRLIKIVRFKSNCSKCCDLEIDTNNN